MNGREMINSDQLFFLSFSTRTNKQRSKIAQEDLREKKKKRGLDKTSACAKMVILVKNW